MRVSDSGLFDLIHSLSKSEKRYFKMFSRQFQKDHGALPFRLFDLIDQQKSAKDQDIKKQLNNLREHSNFSQLKADLSKLLFKSLRAFHSNHYETLSTNNRRSDFELLLNRGLNKSASQILQNMQNHPLAISSAWDNIYLNRLSFRLAIKDNNTDQINYLNTNYYENQLIEINRLRREFQAEYFFIQAYSLFRHHTGIHSEEIASRHKNLLQAIKRSKLAEDESIIVRLNCRKAFFFIHFSLLNFEESKIQAQHVVRDLLSLDVEDYSVWDEISTYLINLFYIEVCLKNATNAFALYLQLSDIWIKHPILHHSSKVYRIQSGMIQLYTDLGELTQARSFAKKLEKQLDENYTDILAYSALIMNLVWMYLFSYQYVKAWELMQKIPSAMKVNTAPETFTGIRLTTLILLLETKNYSLLTSNARSNERFFSSKNLVDDTMAIFLRFFKNYSLREKNQPKKEIFQSLLEQLKLVKHPSGNLFSLFPEIAIWAKANAENKEYVLLIRQKNNA